jgi:hypothetical protein
VGVCTKERNLRLIKKAKRIRLRQNGTKGLQEAITGASIFWVCPFLWRVLEVKYAKREKSVRDVKKNFNPPFIEKSVEEEGVGGGEGRGGAK